MILVPVALSVQIVVVKKKSRYSCDQTLFYIITFVFYFLTEIFDREPPMGFHNPVSFLKVILTNINLGSNMYVCAGWIGFLEHQMTFWDSP